MAGRPPGHASAQVVDDDHDYTFTILFLLYLVVLELLLLEGLLRAAPRAADLEVVGDLVAGGGGRSGLGQLGAVVGGGGHGVVRLERSKSRVSSSLKDLLEIVQFSRVGMRFMQAGHSMTCLTHVLVSMHLHLLRAELSLTTAA